MSLFHTWSRFLARFTAQIEQQQAVPIVFFSCLYLFLTSLQSARRLWYDELFTYYTARLPSIGIIWSALKEGADLNPPLLHLATRGAHALFGDGPIATRVPAILGFLLMCLCLCHFVGRRSGRTYGLAAMTLPVLTGAYSYASEARSYGMVLGLGAGAALSWQLAADGIRRRWTVPGVALLLAAALLTHTYAVLLLCAFGAAEAVRAMNLRRLDLPLMTAIAAPALSVIVYIPLLGTLRGLVLNNSIFEPSFSAILNGYEKLFAPSFLPLLIGAILVAFWVARHNPSTPLPASHPTLSRHEVVFAAVLLAVPLLAAIIAALVTGVFMSRYGLVAVIGFSILAVSGASWAARRSRTVGFALFVTFLGAFCVQSGLWLRDTLMGRPASMAAAKPGLKLEALPADLPLVISNGLLFLEADHYEEPAIVSRLHFLTERSTALSYIGTDVFDKGFYMLRKWFPIRGRITPYRDFLAANKRFLVIGSYENVLEWIPRKLRADGVELRYVGQYVVSYGDVLVLEASLP